jgi:pyrroline-5-carboxylate reductase
MPNMPALVQCSASALFANANVTTEQKALAESIIRAVGIAIWLTNEEQMDTVTALSGSGPAYFFLLMEILEQTATELGLPTEVAHLLTIQTGLGAARLALESKHTVAELREKVTSPGGTTEAALKVLSTGNLRNLIADAIRAAKKRAQELSLTN